jgi:hypothetical protein
MRRIGSVVLAIIGLGGAAASAQSLGEAAQNEKKKRETPTAEGKATSGKTKDKKVYTGEDLGDYAARRPAEESESAKSTEPPIPAALEVPSSSSPQSGGRSPMGISDDSEERAAQERSWRSRAKAAQASVTSAERELKSAESQRGLLGPGPLPGTSGQDPLVWAQKANESDARLARARAGLEAAKKNLEQFEEEARRAGIPPGWIR